MARTLSTMAELGTQAPEFSLPDTEGRLFGLDDFDGARALLVAFICNHCPYVKLIKQAFSEFVREYQPRGLAVVAINANDIVTHPADSPENMRKDAADFDYSFPYLFDETQAVARAYDAACTPDFFLYDGDRKLAYRGQFDDARPGNGIAVTGRDMRAAVDAVLEGRPVPEPQQPSMGCNIKWKTA